MVAARDIQLAQEAVRELRAQGQPERAAAIETLLAAATAAPQQAFDGAPLWTVREAARATGIPGTLIRQWIAAGQLPARIVGGRTLIRPDDFWACVDAIPLAPPPPAPTPTQRASERRRQTFIESGLPSDKRARLDQLHERMEDGHRLTRTERSEMVALERELVTIAGQRLQQWIDQTAGAKR
jgi:excisionase family DNA binding protein